jgi:hypothetical protein
MRSVKLMGTDTRILISINSRSLQGKLVSVRNSTSMTFGTAASHLVMSGVDLATVKKILGHKDISVTMCCSPRLRLEEKGLRNLR